MTDVATGLPLSDEIAVYNFPLIGIIADNPSLEGPYTIKVKAMYREIPSVEDETTFNITLTNTPITIEESEEAKAYAKATYSDCSI